MSAPLAVALARKFDVVGFDIDPNRIGELRENFDRTGEVDADKLAGSTLELTNSTDHCVGGDVYIVTVPTPVDAENRPDLTAVLAATRLVAAAIDPARRPTVVFESTVYPGVTEDICGPEIERVAATSDVFARFLAEGYAMAGMADRAIHWLRVAVDRGYINHPFLARYDPCLEQVRSEPRFQQLLKHVRERWLSFEP